MKVCCVFSLESPHWGDSNEYTQYTIFNIKKKITLNYPKSAATGFCSKGLKNEFEIAMVNEPSVFELLKFYGTVNWDITKIQATAMSGLYVLSHKTELNQEKLVLQIITYALVLLVAGEITRSAHIQDSSPYSALPIT